MIKRYLFRLYKINKLRLRKIIISIILKIDDGEIYSTVLRDIFEYYHKVKVGMYSMGGWWVPNQIEQFTKIGRYCSLARKMTVMNQNHPIEHKSTHALFFNPIYGLCSDNLAPIIPLTIGNDVWIGYNALIMPSVTNIGNGAIIGAGAVVHKNIPPYAIVVGNPARVVRYRFSNDVIEKLLESKWWEKSIEEIKSQISEYQKPYIR